MRQVSIVHTRYWLTLLLHLAFIGGTVSAAAGVTKTFPGGYIVCAFDQSTSITNHGSKLVFAIQHPITHKWTSPIDAAWTLNYIRPATAYPNRANRSDEIDSDAALVIKKAVTIAFWNFKGAEVDVEFTVPPKSIRRFKAPPWK